MAVIKYTKKPEVVDAVHYTGDNVQEVLDFCQGAAFVENEVLYLADTGQKVFQDWWVMKDFAGLFSAFGPNFLDYYKPGGGP